jgi:hypothetical protein
MDAGVAFPAVRQPPVRIIQAMLAGDINRRAEISSRAYSGIVAIVLSSIYGIVVIMAGSTLRKQRGYRFCFFVSILDLLSFPGLVLGIFTLIVLMRRTVKELFKGHGALPPLQLVQVV